MKRRSVQIALAVVLALIATVAVYGYVQRADQRAVAGKEAVTVQVVARLIPAGTSGKDVRDGGYLRSERLPADSVPPHAVTAVGDTMLERVATADIAPGLILLPEMLGQQRTPSTSGLAIPKGKLAVSVQVTAQADVAGYVQPRSQIAVFNTFIMVDKGGVGAGEGGGEEKQDNWTTKILLPRVDVLAVSSGASPADTSKGIDAAAGAQSLMVTVAVTQVEAQRLIHVAQKGSLYLALLSATSQTAPGPGVDNHSTQIPVFPDWATAK